MIEYIKILFKRIYKKIIIKLFLLVYSKPKLLNKKSIDETVVEYSVYLDKNRYQIFEFKEGVIFTRMKVSILIKETLNFFRLMKIK